MPSLTVRVETRADIPRTIGHILASGAPNSRGCIVLLQAVYSGRIAHFELQRDFSVKQLKQFIARAKRLAVRGQQHPVGMLARSKALIAASLDDLMDRIAFDQAALRAVDHLTSAARARDLTAFQEGQDGSRGDALGQAMLRRFDRDGDASTRAWACSRFRWSYLAEAALALAASLDLSIAERCA